MDDAAGRPGGGPAVVPWRSSAVVAVALVALAAGFGQFGAVAALGDVAKAFGHATHGGSLADRVGLSGSTIGIGLAIIRAASLGGLPLTGAADRWGRRRTLLGCCAIGLALTALAAVSPGYWWFVAIFALGRPALSAANALAQVSAGELTGSDSRAKAVALVAAGYGVGAGITAILASLGRGSLGFRGVFALAVVPLVALSALTGRVAEPDRFVRAGPAGHGEPVLGPVGRPFRRRLLLLSAVTFAIAFITGPANSFVFVYAQNVRHVSGAVTSAMVVAAGATGLVGLLAGRSMADAVGRRPTVALAMAGLAACGLLLYSGSVAALFVGYTLGVLAGGVIAPPLGAMVNEVFPTSVRASVAGWSVAASVLGAVAGLVVFGAIADVGNRLGLAAAVTFLPAVPVAALLLGLPETRGLEPEQLASRG